MRVSVAVAQIPVCWSVSGNTVTAVEMIGQVKAGTVLVLPECALSGYDDQRHDLGASASH
jgi:predicted amidohydrolase